MTHPSHNVALLRPGPPSLRDRFVPPILPPLLELRKAMGLTPDEAVSILHISLESLADKETNFISSPYPYNLSSVRQRYLYFLSLHSSNRERNIIRDHLTLQQVREDVFRLTHADMGNLYGGYTARQWYNFETHEAILPRDILKEIEQNAHTRQTKNYDQV
jgi:hypothetical protein